MATARVARPPPGLAFREGAGPGDAPVVTFEAKRAFDAFADSLTAETMNRAARPYDVTASAGSGIARGASGKGHEQRAEPPSTSGAARGAAVVRATRELAARSRASAGGRDDDGAETRSSSDETPLQRFEREMRAKAEARAAPPPFHTVPAHIPLAQDMRREAALDCGVTGSRYPNGPYEPFSWVFNREPEKGTYAREFKRHFPSLKPVHQGQSLGDAVDLRPLVEAERACAEDMRAMRARHGKFHACQRVVGEFDKPARAVFYPAEENASGGALHRPGHFARAAPVRHEGAIDADGRLVPNANARASSATSQTRSDSSDRARHAVSPRDYPPRQPRSNPRLAGAGADGGGFFAPGADADGMETRSVKACSAYATRLIANGRVGGTVVPKDGLGRRVGNPLIGATAAAHVRRGTPLGAFEGVSIERRAREEERADEEKLRKKNAARVVYDLRVHEQGGFKFEQRRSQNAKAEASADSFKSYVAAEKALGFGSPRAAREGGSTLRKSASFTRFPPTYAVREKRETVASFDASPYSEEGTRVETSRAKTNDAEPRRGDRFARISSPAVVREYSRLTMGAAPQVGGEVWTPGASASANVGGWTWRDAATPMPTSLERGDVKGLPRHSAARARVRKEDSVRKLSLRPSATLV